MLMLHITFLSYFLSCHFEILSNFSHIGCLVFQYHSLWSGLWGTSQIKCKNYESIFLSLYSHINHLIIARCMSFFFLLFHRSMNIIIGYLCMYNIMYFIYSYFILLDENGFDAKIFLNSAGQEDRQLILMERLLASAFMMITLSHFYPSMWPASGGRMSKIAGLYLLLFCEFSRNNKFLIQISNTTFHC